jgi:hypothetical protein
MEFLAWILANLGLLTFTVLGVGLILYLAYTMIHPESF